MQIRNSIVLTGAVFASFALPGLADLTDNPSDFNSTPAATDLRGPVQQGDTVPFTNVNNNPAPAYQQPKLDDSYINNGASAGGNSANPASSTNSSKPLYATPQNATDNPNTGPRKVKNHMSGGGGGGGGVAGAALGVPDRAAKTSVGLTDRAAKTSVGLTDRAAKTSIGVPVKVIKSLF